VSPKKTLKRAGNAAAVAAEETKAKAFLPNIETALLRQSLVNSEE
jgi:hypothetical protein